MLSDPAFYMAAIPAVLVLGLAKGGLTGVGMLAVPLLALVMSPVQAAAITLPVLLVQDVFTVWAFRRFWDGWTLALMLPGAALGILAGYLLAASVPVAWVELALGLTVLLFAGQRIVAARRGTEVAATPARPLQALFWGGISGFTSHIAHAGGPPFQIYTLPRRFPREVFVGTGSIFFATVNWMKVPAYAALGQFSHDNLIVAAALVPLAVVSTWAGVWLVRRIDTERFYGIIHALMIVVALKLIWDGGAGLFV